MWSKTRRRGSRPSKIQRSSLFIPNWKALRTTEFPTTKVRATPLAGEFLMAYFCSYFNYF